MAAPLSACTKKEQRTVVRILWTKDVKGDEIYTCLCAQYGENVLTW
jgi:hypothetical protein